MNKAPSCSVNPVARWVRIVLSLVIIGWGIWTKNWIGLLGIVPLATALSGSCPLTLRFPGTRRDQDPPA